MSVTINRDGLGVFGVDGQAIYTQDARGVRVQYFPPGYAGRARWFTDTEILLQTTDTPNMQVLAPTCAGGVTYRALTAADGSMVGEGGNDGCAGGGSWQLGLTPGPPHFRWSASMGPNQEAVVGDCDPTTGNHVLYLNTTHFIFNPAGEIIGRQDEPSGVVCNGHRRLRSGRFLWQDTSGALHCTNLTGASVPPPALLAPGPIGAVPILDLAGHWWIAYTAPMGIFPLVLHPWDSLQGYHVTDGFAYGLDAISYAPPSPGTHTVITIGIRYAVHPGEHLTDGRVVAIPLSQPTMDLTL